MNYTTNNIVENEKERGGPTVCCSSNLECLGAALFATHVHLHHNLLLSNEQVLLVGLVGENIEKLKAKRRKYSM